MRICIVTGEYHLPGETFINRHIQHIFGGGGLRPLSRRKSL